MRHLGQVLLWLFFYALGNCRNYNIKVMVYDSYFSEEGKESLWSILDAHIPHQGSVRASYSICIASRRVQQK
jgi:hypothetical protein